MKIKNTPINEDLKRKKKNLHPQFHQILFFCIFYPYSNLSLDTYNI